MQIAKEALKEYNANKRKLEQKKSLLEQIELTKTYGIHSTNFDTLPTCSNKVNRITENLALVSLDLDAKLIEVMETFKTELSQIKIPITKSVQEESKELTPNKPKDEEDLSVKESKTDTDPLLQRIGSLLEEF